MTTNSSMISMIYAIPIIINLTILVNGLLNRFFPKETLALYIVFQINWLQVYGKLASRRVHILLYYYTLILKVHFEPSKRGANSRDSCRLR